MFTVFLLLSTLPPDPVGLHQWHCNIRPDKTSLVVFETTKIRGSYVAKYYKEGCLTDNGWAKRLGSYEMEVRMGPYKNMAYYRFIWNPCTQRWWQQRDKNNSYQYHLVRGTNE
jgi:hypothetical protein